MANKWEWPDDAEQLYDLLPPEAQERVDEDWMIGLADEVSQLAGVLRWLAGAGARQGRPNDCHEFTAARFVADLDERIERAARENRAFVDAKLAGKEAY
jgi:hypothetical protein